MWTTEFKCYENSETVGTIKATCGHFTFDSTINLGDADSIADFILKAKEALVKSECPPSAIIVEELNNINQKLNN